MTADIHLRPQNRSGVVSAIVRCYDGIFEVSSIDGAWRCSCGAPVDCSHRARVELEMASMDEAGRL